jgi:modulator of FtsH protease HflC
MNDDTNKSEPAKNISTKSRGVMTGTAAAAGGSILAALPKKSLGLIGVLIAAGLLLPQTIFTVDPTERAMVRLLGKVTSEKPLGPGLHFRIPIISHVDRAQVSLTNLHIPVFSVNTIDNQKIDLDINVSYLVPESAVYHLLYEVGRSGDADIRDNVMPVVQDRVSRIFSTKNTNGISEQREGIQAETTLAVSKALKDLFKIDLQSLQIAKIIYGQAFIQSNERSVLAKNEAIAEENRVKVAEFQAKQKVTLAEGEAQQARAKAAGDADAIRLRAKAEKEAAELQGLGAQARYRSEIEGAGGFGNYVALINAQARLKWNGTAPRFMLGGDKGGANFLLPLPESEFRDTPPAAIPTQQAQQSPPAAVPASTAPTAPAVQPSRR